MEGVSRSESAVMFIEHDMEIVSKYASRVIAFYDGRIIADGPTEVALAKSRSENSSSRNTGSGSSGVKK